MILTVTLNPAIDKTVSVDRLALEDRGYILSTAESAGGRGINASAVLHSFGATTLAIVPSGGDSGRRLEAYLDGCGFCYIAVPIRSEIRTNLIITDRQGLTVTLNEPGPRLLPEELEQFQAAVEKHLPTASWLLLCGSLPPGVTGDFYRRLIRLAKRHNVKTLLDAGAELLQEGLEEEPTVVSPNQQEAERLLNKALITRTHFKEAAERIRVMGARSAVVSLGSRGAVASYAGGLLEVVPPRVEAVSPIGAGDALNAALVWALRQDLDFADAVRWAVAAGTASATLPGLRFADLDLTRQVHSLVEVKTAS